VEVIRFAVLARIRRASMHRPLETKCDFFVSDADNFVLPWTLRENAALSLPIVAPFLRMAEPHALYSNFHA
jgi:hypothetical protein